MSAFYRIFACTILFLAGCNISALAANADTKNITPLVNLLLSPRFAGGTGTAIDPYKVATAKQLDKVREYPDKHFIQIADIDLGTSPWNDGRGWTPIGDFSVRFTGTYDGDGYSINNLTIARDDMYQALFANMEAGSTIQNVVLNNVDVEGNSMVGALVGYQFGGDIINSHANGSVRANSNVGGLVGQSNGNITESFTSGSVTGLNNGTGQYYFGGLAGRLANGASISNSYSSASVTGDNAVGGLVGYVFDSTVDKSYAWGLVTGTFQLGGLVGKADGASMTVSDSYWDTLTSGQNSSAGGTGKTTPEMQQQATYTSWDFATIWGINPAANDAYPFLRWQGHTHVPLFAGGDGTPGNPFQVATAIQLDNVRDYLDKYFIQTADIDLSSYTDWEPIGDDTNRFTGSYNGDSKTISNLAITLAGAAYPEEIRVGLFGVSEGLIENVILSNVAVSGHTIVGSLAGQNQSGATIANCSADGTVAGVTYVGGLVGDNYGSITDNQTTIAVTANNRLGGLVGFNQSGGSISLSSSAGTVTGTGINSEMIGGLAGYNNGLIEKSFVTGNITAAYALAGGLVGYNFSGVINNCYATGAVNGTHRVGGLVGDNRSEVTNSYSTGAVAGSSDLGGLIGLVGSDPPNSIITSSYYDSDTSGMSDTGQGEPRTTAQMKQQATYTGWDFVTVWNINGTDNSGYPFLR